LSETPSSPLDAAVQRILQGQAPLPVRSAAARGALPLPRHVLARLYLTLREDPDESVRSDATASLSRLTGEPLREILSDPGCAAEVLAHFAKTASRDESLAEAVAFHPNVPDAALHVLATDGNAAVLELVLTNQERLIRSAGLLDRLAGNPALRPDQTGRILELLDRFVRRAAGTPSESGDPSGAAHVDGGVSLEETARLLDIDVGELYAASEILDGEEFETSADPEIRSAYRRILTMNTAQKAILAMKGGREERMILIRDTNKIVSQSVLRNGRLTEQEVEQVARMRNVSDEILRLVGTNREWVKNYAVVTNLVHNPRTPPGISTNFVSRLVNKDLKVLQGDKNVPEIIRKMAKRTLETRTQKSAPSFRKK
jgi:hypothetical protein